MNVTSVSGSSVLPDSIACEKKPQTAAPVILRQIINIVNQNEKKVKQQTAEFINNQGGTYAGDTFARATTASFMEKGEWLNNANSLIQLNKDAKSKEIGLQIKTLKSQEVNYAKAFTDAHTDTHNMEHIVAQSVLAPKVSANLSDKELKAALAIRAAIVNSAPAYLENKTAHANHVGTTRLIPRPANNTTDPQKFNTLDRDNKLLFDEKGNAFKMIGEGRGFSLQELNEQKKAKEEYNQISSQLIRQEQSASAAFQYNQLGYAHSSVFQKLRNIQPQETSAAQSEINPHEQSNRAADISYFHMVKEINQVPYTSEDLQQQLENDKAFAINTLEVTPTEKIEMVLARLTVTRGEYPSAAVAKQTIQQIGLEIPDCLSELAQPITPEDHHVPYFTLFQD